MAVKEFEPQILTLLGEPVAFTPTGLSEGQKFLVQFDTHYKDPEMSEIDFQLVKKSIHFLFSNEEKPFVDKKSGLEIPFFAQKVYPPCDETEKKLVLQAFLYRKSLLLQDLAKEGLIPTKDLIQRLRQNQGAPVDVKDTVATRAMLGHFIKLHDFINTYDKEQTCINTGDSVYGDVQLDLTDERVLELLRQFVFFTLQSHHPLEAYTKTNPEAPAFISRLKQNPLGERFPQFMKTYKDNQLPIPEAIAKVLASTNLDPTAQKAEIERLVSIEIQKIFITIKRIIPATDPIWKKIGDPNDVTQIIDTLYSQIGDFSNQIASLKNKISSLEQEKKACDDAKALLQKEKAALEKRVEETMTRLSNALGNETTVKELQTSLATMKADYDARILALNTTKGQMEARIRELETEVQGFQARDETQRQAIEDLQQQLAALTAAKNSTDAELVTEREQHAATRLAADAAEAAAAASATAAQERYDSKNAEFLAKSGECAAQGERIAQLEQDLATKEAELTTLREQITTTTAEVTRLTQENAALQDSLGAANEQLRITVLEKDEAEDDNEEAEKELRDEVQRLQTQLDENQAALAAATAQAESLSSQAGNTEKARANLAGELASATAERDQLRIRVPELEGERTTLRAELAEANERIKAADQKAVAAEARASREEARANTAAEAIDQAEAQFQQQKRTLDEQLADRARTAMEEKIALEAVVATATATAESKTGELEALKTKYGATVKKDRATYENAIKEKDQQVASTQKELREKDVLLELLQDAIGTIDTNQAAAQPVIDAIPDADNLESKGHLKELLRKLTGRPRSASEIQQEKAKQSVAQCYNVFLLNFLWNSNFPGLQANPMYKMVNNLFTTGIDPANKRTPPTAPLPGLFGSKQIGEIQSRTVQYLGLIQKLFGLASTQTTSISEEEKTQLNDLVKQIGTIQSAYKVPLSKEAYRYMLQRNPALINEKEYNVSYRITANSVECISGDEPLSKALLMYCFMILLRNLLNYTSRELGTCPLPANLVVSV